MFINKFKKSNKKKGFTLIELIISITIFSLMTVVMTAVVLNMAKVSYTVDRRTDFLNQLDAGTNIIINEMRNAQDMGLCNTVAGQSKSLFIIRKLNPDSPTAPRFFQLIVSTNRLVLQGLSVDPSTNGTCTATGIPEVLTPTIMFIRNLSFSISSDTAGENTTIFTSFEACDNPSVKNQVFSCDVNLGNNPYRYMFAITTRNF
jgi:prepilin-type N-terminal cleavage/methylation domain-containing protein